MSYDIFAFEPSAAPGADNDVIDWYRQHAEGSQQPSYDDASVATPKLQAFYRDLIKIFPPMNGPDAPADDWNADTDYDIGQDILYVSFRWAKADAARETFLQLGRAHRVGVCEVSETPATIHRPASVEAAAGRTSAGAATAATQGLSAPGLAAGKADAPSLPEADGREEKGEGRLYL